MVHAWRGGVALEKEYDHEFLDIACADAVESAKGKEGAEKWQAVIQAVVKHPLSKRKPEDQSSHVSSDRHIRRTARKRTLNLLLHRIGKTCAAENP
jgi:hypothetical protein